MRGLRLLAPLYDVTPPTHLRGVLTEVGMLPSHGGALAAVVRAFAALEEEDVEAQSDEDDEARDGGDAGPAEEGGAVE